MQIYWTKINKVIEESSEVRTYLLECPEGFTWEEGAHTHFAMKGFNASDKPNRSLVRHMSISTLPDEGLIGITTRIKEHCSEFKSIVKNLDIGDEVALFKTQSNVPIKNEGKSIYLLSSGVALATFRPLVMKYFEDSSNINEVYSLNIESSRQFLFTDLFTTAVDKSFTSKFVDNRFDYYEEVKRLASDQEGFFYIVGSDEFLRENIKLLKEFGIKYENIILDKHEQAKREFLL
ncbi:ferredoxin--NADP+ reductase [Pelagirhabdus alkalitolerans]|uniref:Ferredoxin--NADP+ reductase n=1 Tax=Pelagirhabdus alkalitolerans TaxID=1612202 RepID=A0A1G6M357_9BACI|nr:dihydropteridine reductase [Pelagirhabdus alkalitolerans]SDC49744.1 ferredoxin--NADP+ reductase [Pelagirhabdus alkalitolerans]